MIFTITSSFLFVGNLRLASEGFFTVVFMAEYIVRLLVPGAFNVGNMSSHGSYKPRGFTWRHVEINTAVKLDICKSYTPKLFSKENELCPTMTILQNHVGTFSKPISAT